MDPKEDSVPNSRRTTPAGPDTILLTGAENEISRAILAELDSRPATTWNRRLVGRRARPNPPAAQRAIDDAGRPIRAIVHVASVCNTPGSTERTLAELALAMELAERGNIPIYLLSSAFRCDDRAVVAVRASRVVHVVILTSLVVGSGATESAANAAALTSLLDAATSGEAPDPAVDDRLIDLVPSDIVARTVLGLIADGFIDGQYWLTAGELALPAGRVRGAVAALAGRRAIGVDDHVHGDAPWLGRAPLETSLGDRFEHSISELGALGVPALPDQLDLLAGALRCWRPATGRPRSSAAGSSYQNGQSAHQPMVPIRATTYLSGGENMSAEDFDSEDLMDLLCQKVGLPAAQRSNDHSVYFVDLGLDSLAFLQMQAELDRRYGVQLPDDDAHRYTVGDIVDTVSAHLAKKQVA